jgi:cytochrome b-561
MASYSTSVLANLFGIIAIILMLVWLLHYQGGIEYDSSNPLRVFNVKLYLSCVFLL